MICTEQDELTANETFVDCYDLEVKEVHEDCIVVKLINDDPEPDYSGLFDTDWIIGEDEFDKIISEDEFDN